MNAMKARERAMRFLVRGAARLEEAAEGSHAILDAGDRGRLGIERAVLDCLEAAGLIAIVHDSVSLTRAGGERAGQARDDALAARKQEQEPAIVIREGEAEAVTVNVAESPLGLLWRRRGRDGERFLAVREFAAGERLRRDFTRGQIMPRVGVNWSAAGASGRQGGFGNGFAEMTDAALAARRRVEKALDDVGPELAGMLVDVCCFLKGLERVEAERGWPARSAKVVLKTALGMLARHYEPAKSSPGTLRPSILHWGTTDYRPRIG